MSLSEEQRQRYARHLALPEIGEAGQEKLLRSKVLVIGAGGLGSPAAFYLAAAGVGTIGLMDGDTVDLSNLQRQILHTTASVGQRKTESARQRITALDPGITVECHPFRLSANNAPEILEGYDFIIDATDSFGSKHLISRACHAAMKPWSHAGISDFHGQTMTIIPDKTACLHCLFDENEMTGEETPRGPLGALPGVIGSIQAIEAIKSLLDIGTLLTDALLTFDALAMNFRKVTVRRNAGCGICG